MKKIDQDTIISEIVRSYYNGNFDPTTEFRLKQKFSVWLSKNHESIVGHQITSRLWDEEQGDYSKQSLDIAYQQFLNLNIPTNTVNHRVFKLSALKVVTRIAAVVVPVALIVGAWIYYHTPEADSVITASWVANAGAVESHVLADKSTVWIDAGSTLSTSQDKSLRSAQLVGGSYFKIAPEPSRPFIVRTDDVSIRVLGTEFNVEAYPESDRIVVTLINGKINFETAYGQSWLLSPNQQLIYDKATHSVQILNIGKGKTEEASSWMHGSVKFEMHNLSDIFMTLEHKFGIDIQIDPNVKLTNAQYRAQFKTSDSPEFIMNVLKSASEQFDYAIVGKTVKIISPQK